MLKFYLFLENPIKTLRKPFWSETHLKYSAPLSCFYLSFGYQSIKTGKVKSIKIVCVSMVIREDGRTDKPCLLPKQVPRLTVRGIPENTYYHFNGFMH